MPANSLKCWSATPAAPRSTPALYAPLGRAVIGGLLLATVATLFFVPAFFSLVHGRLERRRKAAQGASMAATFDEFDETPE